MIDEPQTEIRFGGTIAAPVAQKIMSEALPYLGIEPVYTEEEKAAMAAPPRMLPAKGIGRAVHAGERQP